MKCTLDIETYSEVNLKKAGLYRYAEHASTDILCVCWAFNEGPVSAWIPSADIHFHMELNDLFEIDGNIYAGPELPKLLVAHIEHNGEIHAWNAQFERRVLNGPAGKRYGFPEITIEQTRCSMARSRASSLPGRLEDAANVLDTPVKKRVAGLNAMRYLCKPRADGTRPTIAEERARFLSLVPYCADDVRAERDVDAVLPDLSPKETRIYHMDQRINDRGVTVDMVAVDNLEAMIGTYKEQMRDNCQRITGVKPTQPGPLADWIRANGYPNLPNLQADTVRRILAKPQEIPINCRAILRLYSIYNMKAVAKYPAARASVCADGRIHGMLGYHAAATGRWASYIVQIHNLFRPVIDDPEDALEAISTRDMGWLKALYPKVDPMQVFASCVRSVLTAGPGNELVFPDFSGIENRWNAWLFGEEWKLNMYRAFDAGTGPHPYISSYAQMFRVPIESVNKDQRQIGKVLELSMGYQGGVGAFVKMAVNNRMDLTKLVPVFETFPEDVKVDAEINWVKAIEAGRTYQLAKEVWKACEGLKILWRKAHPRIVRGWKDLEDAAANAVANPGEIYSVAGKLMFRADERFLVMRLPSGRKVRYFKPELRGERGTVYYQGVDTVTRVWGTTSTYGGKLCENETQAGCRDLLADAMLRFADEGWPIVMHVHDEPVLEARAGALTDEIVQRIMCATPKWAPNFPLAIEGHRGRRYRK